MDRSEIVRKFLDSGFQLASDALSYFEQKPESVGTFLDLASGRLEKTIVTRELVEKFLEGINPKVKILRTFLSNKKESSVEEIANLFSDRYKKTSEIISKRPELTNPISINRISEQTKRFSLIAMIKEINSGDRSIVIEDQTGTTSVYISDETAGEFGYLVEDEVIGLVCDNEESSENRAVKIIFPDVPLSVGAKTSSDDVRCMFLSDIHFDEPGFIRHSLEKLGDYLKKIKNETIVFVLGDVSNSQENFQRFVEIFPKNFSLMFLRGELEAEKDSYLPDPVILEISGVKIFLSHGSMFSKYFEQFKTSPEVALLQLLKKRHLSPTLNYNPGLEEKKLFLDEIPDIFVIGHFHEPRTINYKGVTIISLGSFVTQPIFWTVNLRTRESIKIDLT